MSHYEQHCTALSVFSIKSRFIPQAGEAIRAQVGLNFVQRLIPISYHFINSLLCIRPCFFSGWQRLRQIEAPGQNA